MNNLEQITKEYLNYCQYQKCLDSKTLKAYRIDLAQFISKVERTNLEEITVPVMECYIQHLHETFQPRTAKRKIASLKALFHFLEYKYMITMNPFSKIYTKFREPIILPKTIPLYTVEQFLNAIYSAHTSATTSYQKKTTLRDIALAELLFATGMRISELCDLPFEHVNLQDGTIRICITKISTFLILCDLAVCLATLYVSFSLVFALMRYLQGKVFLIRFYSPTTLSSSRAEFRLPSRLACA